MTVALRPVSWVGSARVLMRLAWARTVSPALLLGMLGVLLLPIFFALVFVARGSATIEPVAFLVRRYDQLVCALATPLVALLLGTSAFGAERDDGTLLYLLTTRTPRWWIAASRMLFASFLSGLLSAATVWATGAIAADGSDPQGVTAAFTVAVFYGGATYAALFTMLALLTRRALVTGLVYVIFWEGVLSSTFPALHYLSVRRWMLAVAAHFTEASGAPLASGPSFGFALAAAVVLIGGTLIVGGHRLDHPRLTRLGA